MALGPALYFPLDDAAAASNVAELVAGHDGTVVGPGVALGAPPAFASTTNGGAARFTPSAVPSGVRVGDVVDLGAGPYTVSLFLRLRGDVECVYAFAKQTFWDEGLGTNGGTSLHFRCGGAKTMLFNRTPTAQAQQFGEYVKPPLPPAETWTHVVVRYDPTELKGMRAFVGGARYDGPSSSGLSGGTISTTAPLMLGSAGWSTGAPFNTLQGDLDEVALFTRALGDDEIRSIACAAGLAQ